MPIGNITQTMSTISPPPHRGVDVQTVFVTKQEDFQDHLAGTTIDELNTFKDQLNTRIGEINSTTTTMNGYATTASAGASTATTKAGEASTSASEALTSRNQAETFKNNASASATKASQWADNNYNVEVETEKYSAKHWSTVAQNATVNKVDKITSTDNAIVRFDGTTGALQNSGVIIDDNGNVGIGTSSPAHKLSIFNPTPLSSTAGSKLITISKYTNVGDNASYLQQQTVRTSMGSNHDSTEERLRKVVDATEMGYIGFANQEVNIGIGSGKKFTLGEYGLSVNFGSSTVDSIWSNSSKAFGTDWKHFYGTSNNNTIANIIICGNGNIINSNNSYGSLSDVKLKENIIDVTPKLDKLMKVRVVNYNLIGQDQKQIGVIAQEIEQIFPALIDKTRDTKQVEVEKERVIPAVEKVTEQKLVKEAVLNEDGEIVKEAIYETGVITEAVAEHIEKYIELETIETGETTKSVKYSVLYMMMLKGMQEQQEIINSLTKRIEILEGAK